MSTIVLEHLQHANSASPDLTVDPSGNIGIGTTTPAVELHVVSSDYPYVRTTATGYTGLDIGQNSENGEGLVKLRDSQSLTFWTGDVKRMTIMDNGSVSLRRVSAVNSQLHIETASGSDTPGTSHIKLSVADDSGPNWAMRVGDIADDGDFHIDRGFGGSYASSFSIERSTGAVLTPYQPCSVVKLNSDNSQGGQLVTVGPSGTLATNLATIKFETLVANVGDNYSTSTGRFTCPVDGQYFVTFNSNVNMSSATGNTYPEIHKNNALYIRAYDSNDYNQGAWAQQSITAIVPCSAGDYLEIKLRCNAGLAWADSDTQYTQASFMLL